MIASQGCATSIIASVGRTCCEEHTIRAALQAGALNFRLPLGLRDRDLVEDFYTLRRASIVLAQDICVLVDLPASRPRIGAIDERFFEAGERIAFVDAEQAQEGGIPLPGLRHFLPNLHVGERIIFRDGRVQFRVVGIGEDTLDAECLACTGPLCACHGCSFPDADMAFEALLPEDREQLGRFAEQGLCPDWVMVSFAVTAAHVADVRREMDALWPSNRVRIMAKIETAAAVENLDELLAVADGLLIGRGDLGISYPLERVPKVQAHIARKAREAGKPFTVATQFLESFALRGELLRAELSDVALAVRQGAAGIVLCAETNNSPRPIESIEWVRRVIEAENDGTLS